MIVEIEKKHLVSLLQEDFCFYSVEGDIALSFLTCFSVVLGFYLTREVTGMVNYILTQ